MKRSSGTTGAPYRVRCLILALLAVAASAASSYGSEWVATKWVADGDTVVLQDGRHVRYIGIDAPEVDHHGQRAEPMGDAAKAFNRRLVEGRRLRLVFDREANDRYGRTLAYVYRRDGLFVNAEMVKNGFAWVLYRFPNVSQDLILVAAQQEAMAHLRGIWRLVDRTAMQSDAYLGNRRSRRFHTRNCIMAKKISLKNREVLSGQWAAFWSGYAPAADCIPFPQP